jgi:transaldolase
MMGVIFVEIFLDTANIEEIKHITKWGIVDGVTTNQKIFLNEKGVNFEDTVKEICNLMRNKPVSIESNGKTLQEMLNDARKFSKVAENVVAKIPMTKDGLGLEAVKILSDEGIKTNVTVMMNFNQLMLATKAGASYVSLFYNRAKDSGEDALATMHNITKWIDSNRYKTKLIVGSIRNPDDVAQAAIAGAHVITIPYKILTLMPFHKKTDETIEEFDKAWQEFLIHQKTN